LRIYADNFVLSYQYEKKSLPFKGNKFFTQQMPLISNKIKLYCAFTNTSIEAIYGLNINASYNREVNEFKSILPLNKGNNKFKKGFLA
jgi:hypothetical protein|tara:strand:+ start:1481 stop:1744 length:264 start_codon:yes stop_codon:yes gene_type:complete